ncbi:MAG: LptF/LptG family permease [Trueperaceae bacterium]|nr:LptF/LptG family permease [Trueperaceae bacterium]
MREPVPRRRPPRPRLSTRIDRYLLRESLPPFLFGLLLYSSLAVVSVTIPRLQWVVGAPVLELAAWLLVQLPQVMVQTFPIALVLAVLLAFGRLASENELLALRAGAVPVRRTAGVFVGLGLVSAVIVLAINQWVLPVTNTMVTKLYWELTAGQTGLFRLAQQALPVDDFTLHFETAAERGTVMRGVRIERWDGDVFTLLRADAGRFDGANLVLTGYRIDSLDLAALDAPAADPAAALAALVRLRNVAPSATAPLTITTSVTQDELVTRFGSGGFEDDRSITRLWQDARREGASATARRQAAVLMQRKLAEPFTNLALLLVAVPLSLAYARTRGVAFGLSLVVTLAWYLFYTFGQLFAQTGQLPVWLGAWLGNLVFAALGLALMARRTR